MTDTLDFKPARKRAQMEVAAPKMLAVLRDVAAHFKDTDSPLGERARAVIAEAEGEA